MDLFPDSATIQNDQLTIGGCNLSSLADKFGTPLYVYDQATLDHTAKTCLSSLSEYYPGESGVTYAGKAFLCTAMAEWTQGHGLWVDCSGMGEIAIAAAAGVPRGHLVAHGVNKTPQYLDAAIEHAGVLVVDNMSEMLRLVEISKDRNLPELWVRYQPGVNVDTHVSLQTGQQGSKFGMDAIQVIHAVNLCRKHSLSIRGIHFHLGSQIFSTAPYQLAIDATLDISKQAELGDRWSLSTGGGWGVCYREDDPPAPGLTEYLHHISKVIVIGCQTRGISLPRLQVEPGRSLVARAGVAIYRVGTIKQVAGRKWVLLDGGLADNPRPALYGARYTVLPVQGPERAASQEISFAGPYCESGDVLIHGIPFPEIHEGDLVAVPVSGAYQLSMSGNYNGALRPAVVWSEGGKAQIIQKRESMEDLIRRDYRLVKQAGSG